MAITCSGIQRVLTAVTIMLFSAALVETQQSTQDAPTTPRTPWGDPDLQGVWTGSTVTQLERPREYTAKVFLTEEEAAALEREAMAQQFAPRPVDPNTGTPLTEGGVGDYNPEWFDSGTAVLPSRRTSLIGSAINGRLPDRPGTLAPG